MAIHHEAPPETKESVGNEVSREQVNSRNSHSRSLRLIGGAVIALGVMAGYFAVKDKGHTDSERMAISSPETPTSSSLPGLVEPLPTTESAPKTQAKTPLGYSYLGGDTSPAMLENPQLLISPERRKDADKNAYLKQYSYDFSQKIDTGQDIDVALNQCISYSETFSTPDNQTHTVRQYVVNPPIYQLGKVVNYYEKGAGFSTNIIVDINNEQQPAVSAGLENFRVLRSDQVPPSESTPVLYTNDGLVLPKDGQPSDTVVARPYVVLDEGATTSDVKADMDTCQFLISLGTKN